MKVIKRIVTGILSLALMLTLCSCEFGAQKSGKYTWIDSNIIDNQYIAGQKRLQDDYAANVNGEWLAKQVYDPVYKNSTFRSADLLINKNKRALLDDESVSSKNLELVRAYDGLFTDLDYRKKLGAGPLKKYLACIDDIKDIDDVSSYIMDNARNPFAYMLINIDIKEYDENRDHYTLRATQPKYSLGNSLYYSTLGNKGIQTLEQIENKAHYILEKAGYSKEEVDGLLSECFRFESELVALDPEFELNVNNINILDADGFFEYSGAYPLKALFEHYGLDDLPQYYGDYKYLSGLSGIYDDEHIEGMKAYFKVNLALDCEAFLDWDTYEYCMDTAFDRSNPFYEASYTYMDRYLFVHLQRSFLSGAMDQAYLDAYYDQETYDDILDMCEKFRDAYKEIIDEKDWLSDDNKKNIRNKLDSVVFDIMKPSNTADYGDMKLLTKEEGGSLLDAYTVLNEAKIRHYADMARMDYDRSFWDIYDPELSTTQTNAFYVRWKNIVMIQAGIILGDFYGYDMGYEQKLGAIGAVLGHELSHAFDSGGVSYDKDGHWNALIEGDDMSVFSDKAGKVTSYYFGYKPFEGADAYPIDNKLSAEAIADMGGVKSALVIASSIEDFDYDLFFRSYASVWRKMDPKGMEIDRIRTDVHPLSYLRVNVTLQQFDEFYETYGIKEGDNMYLAPEKRIAIW